MSKSPQEQGRFPPRAWVVSNEDDDTRDHSRIIANYKPWTSVFGTPQEYLSVAEAEHLQSLAVAEARAEGMAAAFTEAANHLFTLDSSDQDHRLIEENKEELLRCAKAAREKPPAKGGE